MQYGVHALDNDAEEGKTATVTRDESRICVYHGLDSLRNRRRVAVTGQPGIDKTRRSMMYAIQTLLYRNAAVLYVGYKSRDRILFLPRETARIGSGTRSRLAWTRPGFRVLRAWWRSLILRRRGRIPPWESAEFLSSYRTMLRNTLGTGRRTHITQNVDAH